jgi:hypothetical protein
MRVLHVHNLYHLGDNVFNFILFNKLKKYIDEKYIIYYYCQPEYIKQVSEFKTSSNIHIRDISTKPVNSFELWINNRAIFHNHSLISMVSFSCWHWESYIEEPNGHYSE